MIYNEKISLLYDTLQFGIVYFCKDTYVEFGVQYVDNVRELFDYYDVVSSRGAKIPEHLFPFFYSTLNRMSVATWFMLCFVNVVKNDFYDYIDFLKDIRKSEFFITKYIFDNLPDEDIIKIIENKGEYLIPAITNLEYPEEKKIYLSYMLQDFGYFIDILVSFLLSIYPHIVNLHKEYKNLTIGEVEKTNTDECKKLLNRTMNLDPIKSKKDQISISLINKFVCTSKGDRDSGTELYIFGIEHISSIKNLYDYYHITTQSFAKTFSKDVMFQIVDEIVENSEMTIYELSKALNYSFSAMWRYVDILSCDMVLKKIYKNAANTTFIINEQYFKYLAQTINSYPKNIYTKWRRKNDK